MSCSFASTKTWPSLQAVEGFLLQGLHKGVQMQDIAHSINDKSCSCVSKQLTCLHLVIHVENIGLDGGWSAFWCTAVAENFKSLICASFRVNPLTELRTCDARSGSEIVGFVQIVMTESSSGDRAITMTHRHFRTV